MTVPPPLKRPNLIRPCGVDSSEELKHQERNMTPSRKYGAIGLMLLGSLFASPDGGQAAAGPFSTLAGSWSGEGTLTTSGGQERLRCRAAYNVDGRGDNLRLNLRCASASYNFNLTGEFQHRGGSISGSWSESSQNVSGTVSGRARGDEVQAAARGDNFSANLTMKTRGNRQAVDIQSSAAAISGVSITLNKQ
jgi:hypothetical protein